MLKEWKNKNKFSVRCVHTKRRAYLGFGRSLATGSNCVNPSGRRWLREDLNSDWLLRYRITDIYSSSSNISARTKEEANDAISRSVWTQHKLRLQITVRRRSVEEAAYASCRNNVSPPVEEWPICVSYKLLASELSRYDWVGGHSHNPRVINNIDR